MQNHENGYLSTIAAALNQTLRIRKYMITFVILSALIFLAYAYLLWFTAFGIFVFGSFYPVAIVLVSITFGMLLSLIITINIYSLGRRRESNKQLGVSSVATGLTVSFSLCCTTVVPSLLATFGASTSLILSNTGKVQSFFSAAEVPFTALSIALLFFALYMASKSVCNKNCKIK